MNKSTGKWIIIGLVILLIILHHDVWNWDDKEPVFGFMPMALLWQAGISLGAGATWFCPVCPSICDLSAGNLRMAPGERQALGGFEFHFAGVDEVFGPNYRSQRGEVRVTRQGRAVAILAPEKRRYLGGQVMTEAGIDAGLTRDLYVALGEPLGADAWAVRLHVKPGVRWIWLGGALIALGGVVAVCDRRYRARIRAAAPARVMAEA